MAGQVGNLATTSIVAKRKRPGTDVEDDEQRSNPSAQHGSTEKGGTTIRRAMAKRATRSSSLNARTSCIREMRRILPFSNVERLVGKSESQSPCSRHAAGLPLMSTASVRQQKRFTEYLNPQRYLLSARYRHQVCRPATRQILLLSLTRLICYWHRFWYAALPSRDKFPSPAKGMPVTYPFPATAHRATKRRFVASIHRNTLHC